MGETGELVIGGVGLARYLDPARTPRSSRRCRRSAGSRAYRSGDLVRAEAAGLLFLGRARRAGQAGRPPDRAGRGRRRAAGAAAAWPARPPRSARPRPATRSWSGYVVPAEAGFDQQDAVRRLREALPAALVPLLAVVDDAADPHLRQGRPGRAALAAAVAGRRPGRSPSWSAPRRGWPSSGPRSSAPRRSRPTTDFFASGGGSLAAAQLVSLIRTRYPSSAVGDIYQYPTLGALARRLDEFGAAEATTRTVRPDPAAHRDRPDAAHGAAAEPGRAALGRGAGRAEQPARRRPGRPRSPWWWVALGWLLLFSPPGRLAIAAGGARLLLRGVRPGSYPRGGGVHLRLWTAERLAALSGATNLAGAWLTYYARALGVKVGRRHRPALAAARSPACSSSARAARSNPRSTWPATGSTATCCTSARSGSAPARRSAPAAPCSPARGSARRPRSPPAPA